MAVYERYKSWSTVFFLPKFCVKEHDGYFLKFFLKCFALSQIQFCDIFVVPL